jgi:hypothetical protein
MILFSFPLEMSVFTRIFLSNEHGLLLLRIKKCWKGPKPEIWDISWIISSSTYENCFRVIPKWQSLYFRHWQPLESVSVADRQREDKWLRVHLLLPAGEQGPPWLPHGQELWQRQVKAMEVKSLSFFIMQLWRSWKAEHEMEKQWQTAPTWNLKSCSPDVCIISV